jgi:cytochrome c biogenesis protein CcmG, thiol:disulfide interchange protein DsbE
MAHFENLPERIIPPALLLAGILVGVGLGVFLFTPPSEIPSPTNAASTGYSAITPAPAPVVGAPAPAFRLRDITGQAVQLSDLRGAPVLIAFWATWCEPCRLELPMLNQQASRIKILAINMGEERDPVAAYAKDLGLDSLTILLDSDFSARDLYRVGGLPTTFLVDTAGMVRFQKVGSLESSEFDAALAALRGTL